MTKKKPTIKHHRKNGYDFEPCWWTFQASQVKEYSLDLHSEDLPPAVESLTFDNPYGREPGFYAVRSGEEAKDGEYPLGPYAYIDDAKAVALGEDRPTAPRHANRSQLRTTENREKARRKRAQVAYIPPPMAYDLSADDITITEFQDIEPTPLSEAME